MNERITVAIVIPCFNECKRLKVTELRKFIALHPEILFIFVNDGSSDNTIESLGKIVLGNSSKIINLPTNQGKAEAVRQGMLEAVKFNCICGFWDADLATPLSEIPLMTAVLQKNSFACVVGSRWQHLGNCCIKRNWFRHIISRVLATFISLYLKLPIYDSQCGAKLFSAEAAQIVFKEPFITRWLFDVEIIRRLQQQYGMLTPQVCEFPLNQWVEAEGSKLSLLRILCDFIKLAGFLHGNQ